MLPSLYLMIVDCMEQSGYAVVVQQLVNFGGHLENKIILDLDVGTNVRYLFCWVFYSYQLRNWKMHLKVFLICKLHSLHMLTNLLSAPLFPGMLILRSFICTLSISDFTDR